MSLSICDYGYLFVSITINVYHSVSIIIIHCLSSMLYLLSVFYRSSSIFFYVFYLQYIYPLFIYLYPCQCLFVFIDFCPFLSTSVYLSCWVHNSKPPWISFWESQLSLKCIQSQFKAFQPQLKKGSHFFLDFVLFIFVLFFVFLVGFDSPLVLRGFLAWLAWWAWWASGFGWLIACRTSKKRPNIRGNKDNNKK